MNDRSIKLLIKKNLLNARITEFEECTKVHCQMDVFLFPGRVQKMLCKTERWASCNFRHFKDLDKLIVKLETILCYLCCQLK